MKPKSFWLLCLLFIFCSNCFSQNIGIGNSSPAFKLDIQGRMRVRAATVGSLLSSAGIWMDDYRDGSNRFFFGMKDSIRAGFYGGGSGGTGWDFTFNTKNGNIGIGYLDPEFYKLSIDGEIALYHTNQAGTNTYGTFDYNLGNLVINAKQGNLFTSTSPQDIILQYAFGQLGQTSGKVGIGTDALTAKLHVNGDVMIGNGLPANGYMLSVNGKIIGTEVKVQLNGSWPDYVFSNNYKLKTLEELRQFITANKHLPNIPPADEMEISGIELGEMQRKMMEKIEELTLYILQLEEKLKKLEVNHQQIKQ